MPADVFSRERAEFLIGALRPERLTRIVDVGANPIGENPYRNLLDMGGCEVWGFEPQEEAFAALIASKGEHEHYLPHAVGSGETGRLRLTNSTGFVSLLEPNRRTFAALGKFGRSAKVQRVVELPTSRLDDIADLPEFDLLKIDVQGSECAVFSGGLGKLGRAVAVISEVAAVPLYVDQPLIDEQMRILRGVGYDLHKFLFFKSTKHVHPATARLPGGRYRNQLVDGDAVFVRGLLDLEVLESEAPKHLAILADAVFESHDLAAVVLARLAARSVIPAAVVEGYVDRLPHVHPAEAPVE